MRIAALLTLILTYTLTVPAFVHASDDPGDEPPPARPSPAKTTPPPEQAEPEQAEPERVEKSEEEAKKPAKLKTPAKLKKQSKKKAKKKKAKKKKAKKKKAKKKKVKKKKAKKKKSKKKKSKKKKSKKAKKKPNGQPAKILQILVEGNSKTTDETVILVSRIKVGKMFSPQMHDKVVANLVDSGLFKTADIAWEERPGGYLVRLIAKDKHSWIVAPTYYDQPTNRGFGVGFGENNLFGKNEKLLLYGQLATGDSFFIGAYIDPSIAGSRFGWQLDTYLLRERVIEFRPPVAYRDVPYAVRQSKLVYLNVGTTLTLNLTDSVALSGRIRGAKVSYQDTQLLSEDVSDVTDDPNATPDNIPDPGTPGYDLSTQWQLVYDSRANWYGVSHGSRYRLTVEYAPELEFSDFDYLYGTFDLQIARRVLARHNLIFRGIAGYGRNMPFQHEFTGGGTTLRGFKNNQFRGDVQLGANLEYSFPVFSIKGFGLRALAFGDTSYTTFYNADRATDTYRHYLPGQVEGELDTKPWKNTVGVGIRLVTRQIVLPLLGVDFGYGIERDAFEVFLAIGLTDV